MAQRCREKIGRRNGWSDGWINDAVQFHLSPAADRLADHREFGTFPRGAGVGLRVWVPSAEYMLALKLKAMRINDPVKGEQEVLDIRNLISVVGVRDIDAAIAILAKFFPRSGRDAERQRFLLKHLWPGNQENGDEPPRYPVGDR